MESIHIVVPPSRRGHVSRTDDCEHTPVLETRHSYDDGTKSTTHVSSLYFYFYSVFLCCPFLRSGQEASIWPRKWKSRESVFGVDKRIPLFRQNEYDINNSFPDPPAWEPGW